MDHELHQALTDLTAGSTLRLRDGQGRAVVVFEGQVWITQDNDMRDIVLAGGESFSLDRPGLTVVQAFRDTKLAVLEAEPFVERVSSYDLHRLARRERSAAMARAWHQGVAALRGLAARLASRPAATRAPALRACTVGH
jgi:hypothetical protein